MTVHSLTQSEADFLIAMAKVRKDDIARDYPDLGGKLAIPLLSADGTESFFLDLARGRIDLGKHTYQNRGRKTIVLVRLDVGGRPHRNPDDTRIGSPHLHLYREGFSDRWAFPVPSDRFGNLGDPRRVLHDFLGYCNVVKPPIIQRGLFA